VAEISTDYLVVGAGTAGMAFTDALIAESEVEVVLVDRRYGPGGHWNDAYPFVRLHQPAAFYGVNSRDLGHDAIDTTGPNAGWYERVTAAEIVDYFGRVLYEHFLPSGNVQFFGMSDYVGDLRGPHRIVNRLTGAETVVHVRRNVVDATYQETPIPATHVPSFDVDVDARVIPINGLVDLAAGARRFTIFGSGKTAMDACLWLLESGVAPDAIRWIRPRDAWMLDRAHTQPLELVTNIIEDQARQLEAAAGANSVEDLVRRLEACEHFIRLDPAVDPTMFRCATVSTGELDQLRAIDNVVRMGHVRSVGPDEIVLDDGVIPTNRAEVHVDCTAAGLRLTAGRPIFEAGRITLQQVRVCQPAFNAALIGYVEATREGDEKNALCPPNPYPNTPVDWIPATMVTQRALARWLRDGDLMAWLEESRLNAARGIGKQMGDPRLQSALTRMTTNMEPAIANLESLLASA